MNKVIIFRKFNKDKNSLLFYVSHVIKTWFAFIGSLLKISNTELKQFIL
jgi:hypothetical protein